MTAATAAWLVLAALGGLGAGVALGLRLARARPDRGALAALEAANRSLEETIQERTQELRRAERKYRSLVGQAAAGILLWDPDTLEILEANAQAGELFGQRPRDLLHRNADALFAPRDRARAVRALRRVLEVGNVRLDEVLLESRRAPPFPAEVSASMVRFGDEQRVLVLLRDLRKAKELERRTLLLNQQIRRSEKMASIGQLAAGVAHEINNPMGYVVSNINRLVEYSKRLAGLIEAITANQRSFGTLAEVDELVGELEEIAQDASEGVQRVTEIVQALREFSHGGSSDASFEWADLNGVVRNCVTLLSNEVKQRASIELDLHELPLVRCHPMQIGQVVMNLILNAVQAVDEGGRISVSTHQTGDRVQIAVEDDGCGISAIHLPRIFEPFFSTKPVGHGTGLGLAVSHEIVSHHEGSLWVDSLEGRGTRFVLELRIQELPPPPLGDSPDPHGKGSGL